MTQEEHKLLGKAKLQVHHIEAIKDNHKAATDRSNFHTLCYPCHREWHCLAEIYGVPYWEWFERVPAHQLDLDRWRARIMGS
jgi:5-methylcytosine-specific restriction endonuclease McrA